MLITTGKREDINVILIALTTILCVPTLKTLAAAESCNRAITQDVTFSISGRRNVSGHWIVKVDAKQRHSAPDGEPGPWHLDVLAHTPQPCDDKGALQLQAQLTVAPAPARPGYELQPALGSRYKVHLRTATWEAARRACAAEGAHLAVVNSDAEAATLKALFARHPDINDTTWAGAAWVGFHDRDTEGTYLTVLGGRVDASGYNKWIAGQPNNHDYKMPPDVDSDCGGIHRNAELDDLPCSARYIYICEQEFW